MLFNVLPKLDLDCFPRIQYSISPRTLKLERSLGSRARQYRARQYQAQHDATQVALLPKLRT